MDGGTPTGDDALSPSDVGLCLLFDLIQEAVVVADTAVDRILLWNKAVQQLFGYTEDEARSMRLRELVPPCLRDQHLLAPSLAEEPLKVGDEMVMISASTGVACYGPAPTSIEELAKEADRAMYAAKRAKPQADGS